MPGVRELAPPALQLLVGQARGLGPEPPGRHVDEEPFPTPSERTLATSRTLTRFSLMTFASSILPGCSVAARSLPVPMGRTARVTPSETGLAQAVYGLVHGAVATDDDEQTLAPFPRGLACVARAIRVDPLDVEIPQRLAHSTGVAPSAGGRVADRAPSSSSFPWD